MPVVANISSAKYRPSAADSSSTQRSEINTVKNVTIRKIIAKKEPKIIGDDHAFEGGFNGPSPEACDRTAAAINQAATRRRATRRSILRAIASIIIMSTATEAVMVAAGSRDS